MVMVMLKVMVMVMGMVMVVVVETSLKKAVAKAPWCGGGGDVAVQAHLREGKVENGQGNISEVENIDLRHI